MMAHNPDVDEKQNLPLIPNLSGKYYNLTRLYSLINGQLETLKEIIDVFLIQVKEYDVDIVQAIEDGNFQKIHKLTHKFKSSLKLLGIEHLKLNFESINSLAKQQINLDEIRHHSQIIKRSFMVCAAELEAFNHHLEFENDKKII
ncbi:MAG: hypothetical protein M3512_13160 [Bacteroidota bacterium]|nr:hypothetical protein [Bacteroidota bacterium]